MSNDSTYFDGYTYKEKDGIVTHTMIDPERVVKERREKAKEEEQESKTKALKVKADKKFLPFLKELHNKIDVILNNDTYFDRDNLASIHNDCVEVAENSIQIFRDLNLILKESDTPDNINKYRFIDKSFTLVDRKEIK